MISSRGTGRVLLACMVLALSIFGHTQPGASQNRDPYQTAIEAFDKGDYETALKTFRALSENKDFRAQIHLGLMHENGYGLKADLAKAAKLYRAAAENASSAYFQMRKEVEHGSRLVQGKDRQIRNLFKKIQSLQNRLNNILRELDPGHGPPVPNRSQ